MKERGYACAFHFVCLFWIERVFGSRFQIETGSAFL